MDFKTNEAPRGSFASNVWFALNVWQLARRAEARKASEGWWAHKGSNLGPLPCEGNALPLSSASGTGERFWPSEPAIYEVQGLGVKR